MTMHPRVTITFQGRPVGGRGRPGRQSVRRTLTLPAEPFSLAQAREAALKAVQAPEQDSPAFVVREITHMAFN